jgi:hypothetical protein
MSEPYGLRRYLSDVAVSDLHRVTHSPRHNDIADREICVRQCRACPTRSSLVLLPRQTCGVYVEAFRFRWEPVIGHILAS